MTGYFQRMALSAIKPGGSPLRPITGSIYASANFRPGQEPLAMEQHILSAKPDELDTRPVAPAKPPPSSRVQSDAMPERREAHLPPRPAQPRTDLAARPRDVPIRDEIETERPTRHFAVRPDPKPPERQPTPSRHEAILPEETRIAKEADDSRRPDASSAERIFVPVVPGDFQPQSPSSPNPTRSDDRPRLAARRESNGAARVLSSASREPDEIQIHIGRIEVTAAPPPPPRAPAPKAQRKAPSLAEYLGRNKGRFP